MKTTIKAMKQALALLTSGDNTDLPSVMMGLSCAIKREEAQSVEPVAIYQGSGNFRFTGLVDTIHAGTELFTHPAPAKQPLDSERGKLIERLRYLAANTASTKVEKELIAAANMLAADAIAKAVSAQEVSGR